MDRIHPRPSQSRWPRAIRRPPKIETLIAVVPGVGTLEPAKWRDDTGESWFEAIPSSTAPGLAVFAFPHALTTSDGNLWQNVIDSGSSFISDLQWLIEHEKITFCPVVIVAHSFGGVIVKEALRLVYEQSNKYRQFLRGLAAIVLLGTPHSTTSGDWKSFANVLHTGSGTQKKRAMTNDEMSMLAEQSVRFEKAGVSIPVISMYETQKTKLRTLGFPSKSLLVEEKFVVTRSSEEVVIGLDADHRSLCNIDVREAGFIDLCHYLDIALEDARLRIVKGSPEYRPPPGLASWTIPDEDEFQSLTLNAHDPSKGQSSSSGEATHTDPFSMYVASGATLTSTELAQTSDAAFPSARPSVTFPIFKMPVAKNKDFFGREDYLDTMRQALFDESPTPSEVESSAADVPRTYAICGPGGMGKTQLAAEFVYRFQSQFDAIFWIHADKAAKVTDGFAKMAIALGLVSEDSADVRDPVVVRELVRGWLVAPVKTSTPTDDGSSDLASWLIVLDNVDEPDELEDYWPLNGSGCVIITSRDPYTKNSQYIARRGMDLEPFGASEASRFLGKLTKRKDDGSKVAQMLGGLPLAMAQMAGIIVRRALSFEEFVRQYEEEEGHRELFEHKVRPGIRATTYEHNLASVWALEKLKHGAVLLNCLAFLDADGIHERILTQNPHQVALDSFPRTATTYFKAREELLQCSLVTKDKVAERLMVHRLVQDAARSKMSEEQYRSMFMTALTLISSVWPFEVFGWRHQVARWQVCEELFPHVLRLFELSRSVLPSMGSATEDLGFVKLMNDAGWYYHESGNSMDAATFFEAARVAAERLKTQNLSSGAGFQDQLDATRAEIHHNLGCVGTETNDPQSTLLHFQAFKDLVVSGLGDVPESKGLAKSIAFNELGNAWMLNRNWDKAKGCFEEAIKLTKSSTNYDPTDMSFPMVNLGLAHWMLGNFSTAVGVLQEGLHHREDKFGKDDQVSFITGRFLYALGNVTKSQGKMDESFEFHRRALQQFLATIGKNHHRTGDMHVKMSEHHLAHQQYEDARKHLDDALRIFRKRSVLRPELCRALLKRSLVLRGEGKLAAAQADREESRNIYLELRPQNSTTTVAPGEDEVDNIVAFWSR